MELADTPDLGSGARACRFKSCHPQQIRFFVKWIILQGALFFCAFWNLINTVEMGILDLTAILTAVSIFSL